MLDSAQSWTEPESCKGRKCTKDQEWDRHATRHDDSEYRVNCVEGCQGSEIAVREVTGVPMTGCFSLGAVGWCSIYSPFTSPGLTSGLDSSVHPTPPLSPFSPLPSPLLLFFFASVELLASQFACWQVIFRKDHPSAYYSNIAVHKNSDLSLIPTGDTRPHS
jgi:hypothetical protein